jgi:hypothetical protein
MIFIELSRSWRPGDGKRFVLHQTVAITHDIPDAGLQLGDLGTVVASHDPVNVEVEFVAASGLTKSLLTLSRSSLRAIGDQDLIAVRSLATANP